MGTISSVYVVPTVKNDSQKNLQKETESPSQRPNISEEKVMETDYSFGENSEDLEPGGNDLNLAQENFRLIQINKELTDTVERLKRELERWNSVSTNVGEIFGETIEQKMARLDKILMSERQEKWEIIEKSERRRVDLVNREKELIEKNKRVDELESELENSKRHAKELELVLGRLKTGPSIESQESDERTENSGRLKSELERFRADLSEKREARRKALSAVSSELNRLRDELENEKEVRRKLERDLQVRKKTDVIQDEDSTSDLSIICAKRENETLKKEVNIITDDIEKLKELRTENTRLKSEIKQLSHEIRSLNTVILQLKNDYKEEKRKLERTNKEKAEIEKEKDRNAKMRKDLEKEKEKMWEEYDKEKEEINKRTSALKEVIEISRQMLVIRESQVEELKTKLKEIEESVAHSKILEEEGLRAEYEKQLENIKTLKELYEERVRLMETERDKLKETISQHLKTIEDQKGEIDGLKERCGNTSEELEKEKLENESLETDLKMSMAKSKDFENELTLMNNMFTQMLLGPFNAGNDTDLDKLTEFLQENHKLITELTTKEESSEIASAFPKLLLDLLTQAEGSENPDPNLKNPSMLESTDTISEQSESVLEENQGAVLPILSYKNATVFRNPTSEQKQEFSDNRERRSKPSESVDPAVQEIASNLPKVWKVLTELLSIHSSSEGPTPGDEKMCYKNIETPYGTKSVISVSNTFIRLKDLILEKKSLQKELGRLKQLNSHLETRLDDQEKRLSQVQCELHKTWGIVGKMRAQHQQLHNHEKILRYELQEKRIMLGELKQELEYCRDKWERARQKNAESETEWKKLRKEFAARKIKNHGNSNLNDSAESGFSDEPNESGEEAENFDADRSSTQSPIDKNLSSEEGTSKGAVPKVRDGSKSSDKSKSRAIRLKRLEDQCQLLVRQVDITTHKSNYLSNRLEELHEHHASSEEIHRPITLKRETEISEPPSNVGPAQTNQTEEAAASLQPTENGLPPAYHLPGETGEERSKLPEPEGQASSDDLSDKFLKNEGSNSERPETSEKDGQELVAEISSTSETSAGPSDKSDDIRESYLESKVSEDEVRSDESEILVSTKSDEGTQEKSERKERHLLRLESEAPSPSDEVTDTVEKSKTLSEGLENVDEQCVRREAGESIEKKKAECTEKDESSSGKVTIRGETREERLQRLEFEGQSLLSNVISTVEKSENLSNKLDEMHARCLRHEILREDANEKVEKTSRDSSPTGKENEDCEAAISSPVQTEEEKSERVESETLPLIGNFSTTLTKSQDLSNKLERSHEDYVKSEPSVKSAGEETNGITQENANGENTSRGAIPKTETRAERLKRLEEECRSFKKKVTDTVQKSIDLSNKLEDIHDTYVNYEVSKMNFTDENTSKDQSGKSEEKKDKEKDDEEMDKEK